MKKFNVAVVGATGMVGREMIEVLELRDFPVENLRLLASHRSKGKHLSFHGRNVVVEELKKDSFNGIDIALFSAGASISKEFVPYAAESGAIVIDNSSAFRMDRDIPLIVPEVNPKDIDKNNGIIANPNCSTIQLVVVLNAIHKVAKIKRIVVVTYQSVSGWGKEAVDQLWKETHELYSDHRKDEVNYKVKAYDKDKPIPYQIAFNLVPQIDKFLEGDYTKEELKVVNETNKILNDNSIKVTATCVRVPVIRAHSEAVNLELESPLSVKDLKKLLANTQGIVVVDDSFESLYPMPADAAGKEGIYVGRIRQDTTVKHGLNLWIVSDNLLKGAALNAVQIAEYIADNKK